jgi:hypothetical protein
LIQIAINTGQNQMGITICNIHGRGAFVQTCSHIAKQINERKPPVGHRLTIWNKFYICDDCFNSLGFEHFVSLADLSLEELIEVKDGRLEAFEVAYNAMGEGWRLFCLKCVAELEAATTD